jgi:tRNA (guanine-N7-)-methyltransferase
VGKNKLAKFAEMAHFENVYQPSFTEIRNQPFALKGNWANSFFQNEAPCVVELGCGKGEYTVQLAAKFPDRNYIGIDIKGARIYSGAKEAIEKGVKNAAFVRTRIENTAYLFTRGEIDEIWLTFPDPQPKKVNKRLTSTNFLNIYLKFLKRGGKIHLKTDSMFLYSYTLAVVNLNGFEITCQTDDLYASEIQGLELEKEIITCYEKQWLERGIPIKYLAFIPQHDRDLAEPVGHFKTDGYRSFGRSARSNLKDG